MSKLEVDFSHWEKETGRCSGETRPADSGKGYVGDVPEHGYWRRFTSEMAQWS